MMDHRKCAWEPIDGLFDSTVYLLQSSAVMSLRTIAIQAPCAGLSAHAARPPASHKSAARPAMAASKISGVTRIADVSAFRASKAAKASMRCRAAATLSVRSEISYVMIKPDGKNHP